MASLLTLIILTTLFHIYYFFTKRKYKKYGDSPINRKIDLIYKEWYMFQGFLLTRRDITVYDINSHLYCFRENLIKVGISKQDIESYINTLTNNKKEVHLGIKDVIIWVLSFITTNSLFTNIINENKEQIIKNLQDYFSESSNIVTIFNFAAICLLIILMINVLWIIVRSGTINAITKENHRLFSLNAVLKIWDYKVDSSVTKIEDIKPNQHNIIYPELTITQTKLEKVVDSTLGSNAFTYLNSLIDQLIEFLNKIGSWIVDVLKIIIVLVIPNLFGILVSACFFLTINLVFIRDDIPIGLKIIIIVPLLIIIVFLAMLYISFFKTAFETHKLKNEATLESDSGFFKVKSTNITLSAINWIQILGSPILYIYLTIIVSNSLGLVSLTILLPIILMIYSIIWSPSRSEN